jgi:putative transposase
MLSIRPLVGIGKIIGSTSFQCSIFPLEIRKVMYTTNAIESLNMTLRKVTKNHRVFPNDEAVLKVVYLAIGNLSKKWTMPIREWKPALNRFAIEFEGRLPKELCP